MEEKLKKVRFLAKVDQIDVHELFFRDKHGRTDPELGVETGFMPFDPLKEKAKVDLRVPAEIRKLLSKTTPEQQNLYLPVIDDETRSEYLATQEMLGHVAKAKWDWYVDSIYSRYKMMPTDVARQLREAKHHDEYMKPRVELMYNVLDRIHNRY